MSNLNLTLRTANVPDTLAHESRKREIESLVNYLEVQLATPGNAGLLNFGNGTPAIAGALFPWLKTAIDGSPQELLVKYEGEYKDAIPYKTSASLANLRLDFGSSVVEASVAGAADIENNISTAFPYAYETGTTPFIIIVPAQIPDGTKSYVFNDATKYTVEYRTASNSTQFTVYYKTPYVGSTTPKYFAFNWFSIGQISQ